MPEKYTILFVAIDAVGHMNACIGIAETLRDRGHKIVFATPASWKGKLAVHGFIEELYDAEESSGTVGNNKFNDVIAQTAKFIQLPSIELQEKLQLPVWKEQFRQLKFKHARSKEIIESVKPNVIVADLALHDPAFMNSGIPWILSVSGNPIGISNKNVPPVCSGYPIDGDKKHWEIFNDEARRAAKELFDEFRKWVIENGGPSLKFFPTYWVKYSPWANIYQYPNELDYTELRPNPPNWHRFDTFVRKGEGIFEPPQKFADRKGKLVYFSLGTIGCVDVDLMKRLINILAKSPNKLIVSKGPRADEFELADNMWGLSSLPQTKVLPMVDLVLTHGGNNTVTECFYFGKKMLVLPLLWDQLDNAQRIHETGLGRKCHPYKVTEEELLSTIEQLLADELLEKRIRTISQRIQSSNNHLAVAKLVEKIAASTQTTSGE